MGEISRRLSVIGVMALLAIPAQAQMISNMPCQPIDLGGAALTGHGFARRAAGVDGDGEAIELWTDAQGNFALLVRRPRYGSLCLLWDGEAWELAPQPAPGTGS